MKKIITLTMMLMFSFILLACTPTDNASSIELPKTLKEGVTTYHNKLTAVLEVPSTKDHAEPTRFYNNTPYNPDDMLPRIHYQTVYDNMRHNTNDVVLSQYLMHYKDRLDEVLLQMADIEDDAISADVYITFQGVLQIEAFVYLSKDGGITLRYRAQGIFSNTEVQYGIKMGYKDDLFYLKELKVYEVDKRFDYFEFLEDSNMITVTYSENSQYRYQYVSQVNNERFDISYTPNNYGPDGRVVYWFNPETNISAVVGDGYESTRHFELFNEKTSIFSYSEYGDGMIALRFQLLEASGWDHAYLDSNAHRNEGVYVDNYMLFTNHDYRQFNVDLNFVYGFANVGVTIDMPKANLTQQHLNLNYYDMEFNHPEITLDYIESVMANIHQDSADLAKYDFINFSNIESFELFYSFVDNDLKIDETPSYEL